MKKITNKTFVEFMRQAFSAGDDSVSKTIFLPVPPSVPRGEEMEWAREWLKNVCERRRDDGLHRQ
jgi:hypothetical protein